MAARGYGARRIKGGSGSGREHGYGSGRGGGRDDAGGGSVGEGEGDSEDHSSRPWSRSQSPCLISPTLGGGVEGASREAKAEGGVAAAES